MEPVFIELRKSLACLLSLILVVATIPDGALLQAQQAGGSGQGAPLSAADLQSLVAPIALYPDALVAQILGAATFPDQIADANSWLHNNQNLTGSNLMKAVDHGAVGPEREGADAVSVGAGQHGEEPELDLFAGRSLRHAGAAM